MIRIEMVGPSSLLGRFVAEPSHRRVELLEYERDEILVGELPTRPFLSPLGIVDESGDPLVLRVLEVLPEVRAESPPEHEEDQEVHPVASPERSRMTSKSRAAENGSMKQNERSLRSRLNAGIARITFGTARNTSS